MGKISEKIYCAFCKIPRKIYTKKHISGVNIFLSLLTAILVMLIFWQEFSPKVAVILVIFIAISETFVQFRWRLSISCPHCGFDPVLYLRDQKSALFKVQEALEARKSSPDHLLSVHNPLLNLPRRIIAKKTLLEVHQEQLQAARASEELLQMQESRRESIGNNA